VHLVGYEIMILCSLQRLSYTFILQMIQFRKQNVFTEIATA
jgi:hypothetical protein